MIIVAGTLRIPEDRVEDIIPIASAALAASRAEDGCITYTYGFDVEDRGLLRVFEQWESRAHLEAHFEQDHMKPWRDKLAEVGAGERDIRVYEAAGGEPI
jgi:quinol monooxygenase YgiN